jgi:hypothetical protein
MQAIAKRVQTCPVQCHHVGSIGNMNRFSPIMASGKKVRGTREKSPIKAAGDEETMPGSEAGGSIGRADRYHKEAVATYIADLRATAARARKIATSDVPAATAEYLRDLADRLDREATEIETGVRPFTLQR